MKKVALKLRSFGKRRLDIALIAFAPQTITNDANLLCMTVGTSANLAHKPTTIPSVYFLNLNKVLIKTKAELVGLFMVLDFV